MPEERFEGEAEEIAKAHEATSAIPASDASSLPTMRRTMRPVRHDQRAVGPARHCGVVGHDDEGEPVVVHAIEHVEHLAAGDRVEVSRRFVREEKRRLHHCGTGEGDPLALATGELIGAVSGAIAQIDSLERFEGALAPLRRRDAGEHHRELDVLERGEAGDEMEELEHETDVTLAELGELGFVEPRDLAAV